MPGEVRLILRMEGGAEATATVSQVASTFGYAFQQALTPASDSLLKIQSDIEKIAALAPMLSQLGHGMAGGFTEATEAANGLMSKIDQLLAKQTAAKAASLSGSLSPYNTPQKYAGPRPEDEADAAALRQLDLTATLNRTRETAENEHRQQVLAQQQAIFNRLQREAQQEAAHQADGMNHSLQRQQSLLSGIGSAWGNIGSSAVKVAAVYYDLERAGSMVRALGSATFGNVISSAEDYKKFQVGISGPVGGMDRAGAIDSALLQQAQNIPLTLREIRETALMVTKLADVSSDLATGSTADAAKRIGDFTSIIGRLSAANPESDTRQVIETVQQMLEGQPNVRNVRRVLGIDPNELGRLAGMPATAFAGDPEKLMGALGQYLDRFFPQGASGDRFQLVSTISEKIENSLSIAAQKIGEDGQVYEHLRSMLSTLLGRAATYVTSAQGGARFTEIGQSMNIMLDSIGNSVLNLAKELTGARDLEDLPDAIGRSIRDLAKTLGDWSKELPGIASDVGAGVKTTATAIKDLANFLSSAHQMASHPSEAGGSAMIGWFDDKWLRLDPEERKRRQLEVMQGSLADIGLRSEVSDYTVKTPGLLGTLDEKFAQLNATGATANPGRAALTQRLIALLENTDPNAMKNPSDAFSRENVLSLARSAISGFDQQLAETGGTRSGAASAVYKLPPELAAMEASLRSEGYLEPGYANRFRSFINGAQAIAPESQQPNGTQAIFRTAEARIGGLLNTKDAEGNSTGYDAFTRIRMFQQNANDYIDQMIRGLEQQKTTDAAHAADIQSMIDGLAATQKAHLEGYTQKSVELADDIVAGVGRFGEKITKAATKEGSTYAAAISEMFRQGQTDIQVKASRVLAAGGFKRDLGFGSIDTEDRESQINQWAQDQIKSITQAPELSRMLSGGQDLKNLSGKNIADFAKANQAFAPSDVFGQGTAQMQMSVLQQQVDQQIKVFDELRKTSLSGAGGPEVDARMKQVAADIDQATQSMRRLSQETTSAMQAFLKFGEQSRSAVEGGLSSALFDVLTRTGDVRQAFRSMAESILHDFTNMLSHLAVEGLIGSLGQQAPGGGVVTQAGGLAGLIIRGLSGLGGAGGGAGGALPVGLQSTLGADIPAAAMGGVFPGLRFFSSGGVVDRPTLAITGERGDGVPEAVIPMLGHGGSIPLGYDSSGIHARLPSGQRIPASFSAFADGGIAAGGFGGSSIAAMGVGFGGGISYVHSGGRDPVIVEVPVTIHNHTDVDAVADYSAAKHGTTIMNKTLDKVSQHMQPGGNLRRMLAKST